MSEQDNPCRNAPSDPTQASEADRECAKRQADKEATLKGHAPVTIDFTTFIFSLATQAFVSLGETQLSGEPIPSGPPDLDTAKQLIDILEMLQGKSRGNLSENEAHLLATLLYDLRMRYVQIARGTK